MHITEILLRKTGRYFMPHGGYIANGRNMTELEFPYVPVRDLKLKNKVSGKFDKESAANCMTEMTALLMCLKTNNFLEAPCVTESKTLADCHVKAEATNLNRKLLQRKGEMNYGSKHLNHRQLNELMKKYPQKIDGKPSRS